VVEDDFAYDGISRPGRRPDPSRNLGLPAGGRLIDEYPVGTVRALLRTDAVTPPTRKALEDRLAALPVAVPRFLDAAGFATLQAVCARLLPGVSIDVAGPIDARLADGSGDGWRYDALPPDREAYRAGMAGFNEAAQALFGQGFAGLAPEDQDKVVQAVQDGSPPGAAWQRLPAARFFEELLAEATEVHFAHPLAQESIGYVGMADAPGWQRIGLNEREDREPSPSASRRGLG